LTLNHSCKSSNINRNPEVIHNRNSSDFTEYALIFDAKKKRWKKFTQCLWQAPSCLESVCSLSGMYSDCRTLFVDRLGLRNASLIDVVDELLNLSVLCSLERRKELILMLNGYLGKNSSHLEQIQKMKGKHIIPVRKNSESGEEQKFVSFDEDGWYLADRPSLQESFSGMIWLSDFTIQEVRSLGPLIEAMGLRDQRLSQAVEEDTECIGDPIRDEEQTRALRQRASYLPRLTQSRIYGSEITF
jgi:hypothetical protein